MFVVIRLLFRLYLIEILHQTTTKPYLEECFWSCILSKFYIKPQREIVRETVAKCCILSKFYIKPQLMAFSFRFQSVVSYRNSTSNHNNVCVIKSATPVVSYRNSTSNHNLPIGVINLTLVVSYRNSTSNHNKVFKVSMSLKLYLIEILHQTTTAHRQQIPGRQLYLIEILHQTTTLTGADFTTPSLYLIEILHQTTTLLHALSFRYCCILSKLYIKPQQSS